MHKLLNDLSIDTTFGKYEELSVEEAVELWTKNLHENMGL